MRISDWSSDVCSSDLAKASANWLLSELFGALNRLGRSLDDSPVNPEQGAELLALVADGTISGTLSKQVFEIMLESGDSPAKIRSEEHTSELQSLMRISYAVFCLKKKTKKK